MAFKVSNMGSEVQCEGLIILTAQGGLWHARTVGGREAQVRDLFGTDTLPTPFGQVVPSHQVAAVIQELNPRYLVLVEEGCDHGKGHM